MGLEDVSILILDDEVDLLQVLAWDFEDQKMKVYTTSSATEALDIVQKQQVKVVLSDLKMPEVSGLEFFRMLKNRSHQPIVKILMTAFTDYREEEVKDLGVTEIFKKPLKTDDLIKFLEEVLG